MLQVHRVLLILLSLIVTLETPVTIVPYELASSKDFSLTTFFKPFSEVLELILVYNILMVFQLTINARLKLAKNQRKNAAGFTLIDILLKPTVVDELAVDLKPTMSVF